MIDFTFHGQIYKRPKTGEREIILGKNRKPEKLFLLHMIYNTSKDSSEEENKRMEKLYTLETTITSIIITVLLSLIPIIVINFSNETLTAVVITFLLLEFVVILWTDIESEKIIHYGQSSLTFFPVSHIKELFQKLEENWFISIYTPEGSFTQIPVFIKTESEIKKIQKTRKKYKNFLKNQVKDIKNNPSIEEIAKKKENWLWKTITLKGYLIHKRSSVCSNNKGCFVEYHLYDKTGKVSFVKFFIKKHFWQKTITLMSKKYHKEFLRDGKYEVSGTWAKQRDNIYYFILKNAKPIK